MPALTEENYGNLLFCAHELHEKVEGDTEEYFSHRKDFARCVATIGCKLLQVAAHILNDVWFIGKNGKNLPPSKFLAPSIVLNLRPI